MKINKLLLKLFLCIAFTNYVFAASSTKIQDYKIITEDYVPFNYYEDGKITGISVEILEKILLKMKSSKKIKDLVIKPWNQALNEVQVNNDSMIFSVARTKERENSFKWVGPIFSSKYVLFAKKNSEIKISSAKKLKKYKIGVIKGDHAENKLRSIGVTNKNISTSNDIKNNLKKLLTDKLDLVAVQENSLKSEMNKIQENYNDLEVVFELDEKDLYFAFNINTPDELINNFTAAFKEVKNSKIYNEILDKYLNKQ